MIIRNAICPAPVRTCRSWRPQLAVGLVLLLNLMISVAPLAAASGYALGERGVEQPAGLTPPRDSADQEGRPEAKRYPPKQAHRPTPVPDRIVLTWSADPATTQAITWRTDDSVQRALVEWALAGDGPNFVRKAKRMSATSQTLKTNLGAAQYHTAVLEGLEPKTKYVYRAGDGTNWSEWSHFQTASTEPSPFSFIYFGDAQNDVKSHWSRVVREAFKEAPRAAFMLHAGDLVNVPNNDAEWGEWFYSSGWIARTLPSIATPGNHEYRRGELSRHWRPVFEFPRNGPENLSETVYYVDYQGTRIISLNSNADLEPQIAWFRTIMENDDSQWTIVTMHHPVFSTARGRDNPRLRKALMPLFDEFSVDLVLQGHDHTYGRTGLMTRHNPAFQNGDAGESESEQNLPTGAATFREGPGTVYVVSVSGPKMYELNDRPEFVRMAEQKQLYQVISVDAKTIRYSAYTATGKLYDRFELNKVEGGGKELIEMSGE